MQTPYQVPNRRSEVERYSIDWCTDYFPLESSDRKREVVHILGPTIPRLRN